MFDSEEKIKIATDFKDHGGKNEVVNEIVNGKTVDGKHVDGTFDIFKKKYKEINPSLMVGGERKYEKYFFDNFMYIKQIIKDTDARLYEPYKDYFGKM